MEGDSSYDEKFAKAVALLTEFVICNGRLPTGSTVFKGTRIGGWMLQQRTRYRTGKMPAWRVARLEAVPGWEWRAKDTFPQKVMLLKEHMLLIGEVPKINVFYKGYNIGKWASQQRSSYQRGEMAWRRVRALEAIPGWRWTFSTPGSRARTA